jgi:DNA polymerase-3 subunit gamma/tau
MSYLVLARKYRPQTFDQVVKQEHVTQTLTNAIASERVAHAILFSGPRGTGKTTVARVLAKAMNCAEGPSPVPCNQCRSCREITGGSASDVFEIDGASNNGVDQIRELRENLKYMPAHSRYKIYIIDEVHMLSIAAFNALLKTLEEPPAHVMFIFATTEPHKIPITILSRCQRHDFRRISIESVSKHLAWLCEQEGIAIPQESLNIIARESGGSMRDALSLLDQVMTSAEGDLTHEQVLDMLGIIDRAVLFDISGSVLRGDIAEVLDMFDEIYSHGYNLKELYANLMEHFRNLLVIKMGKKVAKLVDIPEQEIGLMADQIRNVSDTYLSQILDILFKEESAIHFSSQPKLALEMAFIRIFQTKPAMPIDALIKKLDDLKNGIYELPAASREIQAPASPATSAEPQPIPKPQVQSPPPHIEPEPPEPELPEPEQPEPEPAAFFDPESDPEANWQRLTHLISKASRVLGPLLEKCSLKDLSDARLEIEIGGNGFNVSTINKKEQLIKKICNDFFKKEIELVITAGDTQNEDRQQKRNETEQLKKEALADPLVEAALEIFSGRVSEIKVLQ